MTTRDAWITALFLAMALLVLMGIAGAVSEWIAPVVEQTEIGNAWSQAPK